MDTDFREHLSIRGMAVTSYPFRPKMAKVELKGWVNRKPWLMRQASLDRTITIGEYTTS